MKKNCVLLLTVLLFSLFANAAVNAKGDDPLRFQVELEVGFNPSFTVSNVDSYTLDGYDIHIVAVGSAEIVCDYIFDSIAVKHLDRLYSDNTENPISSIAKETNKTLIPDGAVLPAHYDTGYTLLLTRPGLYELTTSWSGMDLKLFVMLMAEKLEGQLQDQAVAQPSSSRILINGEEVAFEVYNINGNNYFKLRDIAMVLNGTEKQFGVDWDGEKNAVSLSSAKPYLPVGSELLTGTGEEQVALVNQSAVYLDGALITPDAYRINGNNYFKLRDLGRLLNFGISYDPFSKSVYIETSSDYIVTVPF